MHNLVMSTPPPNMDAFAPEFCFCGKRTVEFHEFWFCSTNCARLDSLRSLDDPECHYRDVMRKAYLQAGVQEPYPRRAMSADHLRPGPPGHRAFARLPPRFPLPTNSPHRTLARGEMREQDVARFPTLSQVTGKIYTSMTIGGWLPAAPRQDRPKRKGLPTSRSRARPAVSPEDRAPQQISLDLIPLPEPDPAHAETRVPEAGDGLKNNIRKSVAGLLNIRYLRGRESENHERVFGHRVNVIVPPVREESLPSHRQKDLPSIPAQMSKTLRRSASLGDWDTTRYTNRSDEYDPIMELINEMCEKDPEGFGPVSVFDLGKAC